MPKRRVSGYGSYNNDYYHLSICNKANVKRLLENLELAPPHKRLKACLIKLILSDPKRSVYWKDIEPLYTEIERLHEEMLAESKRLAKALHPK